MAPLVSILIPAYNAERWIADAIGSAVAQTWSRTEIIVVDDGSRDATFQIARRFAARNVAVLRQQNEGAAAARNRAFAGCQGEYIQWLDADDLLASDKVEHQVKAAAHLSPRVLLSGAWGSFSTNSHRAKFVPTSLWQSLAPAEWLLRKLRDNLHMQTATWLVSRELTESAGSWDTRQAVDDDGEYFCRVLLASGGTLFVPEAKVFYRMMPSTRLSHIGSSDRKKDAMLLSMKRHIDSLRALEDSERVRQACIAYLQTWYVYFYPERQDIVAEMQRLSKEVGGSLQVPRLRPKYAWIQPIFGWAAAKNAQAEVPNLKVLFTSYFERALDRLNPATDRTHRG